MKTPEEEFWNLRALSTSNTAVKSNSKRWLVSTKRTAISNALVSSNDDHV